MWIKLEVILSDEEVIYLPASTEAQRFRLAHLVFGSLSSDVNVRYSNDLEMSGDCSFKKPGRVRITTKLKEKLLIPEGLVYQLKITGSNIMMGPVIGLLLGGYTHHYNPEHMKKYSDRFGIYDQIGGLVYAFSLKWIDWKNRTTYGMFYNFSTSSWEYGNFPLPDVIYRRDFHSSQEVVEKLMSQTQGKLFNSYRFTKIELFNLVKRDPVLCEYLPPTELSQDSYQVKRFIHSHGKVILKPIHLSRGRGMCIIEKTDKSYKVTDYRNKCKEVLILKDSAALEGFFSKNQSFFCKYLVQKYLPLARIGDSLFDIRVVMQKGKERVWGCTGIECRVSNGNSHLTNISQGGYALSLEDALKKAFPVDCDHKQLSQQIHQFCMMFCKYMDSTGGHYAELGMDVAVDVNKNLWLIEANVFPSFKGFKTLNYQTYLAIRYKPLLYALSLTEFGK